MKKVISLLLSILITGIVFAACTPASGSGTTPVPTLIGPTAPLITNTPSAATPAPTAVPTPTIVPTPTGETPDSAGTAGVLFDIYQYKAERDLNFDGSNEKIEFAMGTSSSQLTINGTAYTVSKPKLAQLFAITDIKDDDKILEIVVTEEYDPDLADSEKPYSYVYWWNGTKLIYMGELMDVKFDGAWRNSFDASKYFDGKGQVTYLSRTEHLTDLWYMGHYKPSGTDRKLKESYYTAKPINQLDQLKCKHPCLILEKIDDKYFSSMYDYYWIPTLAPYTLGRVPNVDEGIKIIAQTGEKLTITGVYGKYWFRVKTYDGYQGWIYSKNKKVGAYYATMGWTAQDMFDGIIIAG